MDSEAKEPSERQEADRFPERYKIESLIARGGMGEVFRAFDSGLGRQVAIKVHAYAGASEAASKEWFLRESKILAVLDHPNVVRIYSSGLDKEQKLYSVMEFIEGESLAELLKSGPLKAEEFSLLFRQVLSGLTHCHANKVLHRDLKPSNIMRCQEANGSYVYKLIDFGIARFDSNAGDATLSKTGVVLGSPKYMSPEQCRGERGDQYSDIYSLGCIMYECLSGSAPFEAESNLELMYKHLSEAPPELDSKTISFYSGELFSLINSCLAKSCEDRPRSAEEVLKKIEEIFSEGKTFSPAPTTRLRLSANQRKYAVAIALVGACAALALFNLYSLQTKNEIAAFQAPKAQQRVSRQIEKEKNRLSKWAQKPDSGSQNKLYIRDLLALGRSQVQSEDKKDLQEAEAGMESAVSVLKENGGVHESELATAYALMAKAQWRLQEAAKAEKSFKLALEHSGSDVSLRTDILFERSRFYVSCRKFADAYKDTKEGIYIYDHMHSGDTSIDLLGKLEQAGQKLDPHGPHRSDMMFRIVEDLSAMKPESSKEAEQMLELSNMLARRLSICTLRTAKDVRDCWNLSSELMYKIENPELKKATSKLLAEHPGWQHAGSSTRDTAGRRFLKMIK